jgi:hypothetical protein
MKVKMKAYMTGPHFEYVPGDIAEFDADECARLISVGGAEALPATEIEPVAPPAKVESRAVKKR